MDLRRLIRDYLTFTRKERISVIVLLILITLIWAFPLIYKPANGLDLNLSDSIWANQIVITEEKENSPYNDNPSKYQYDRNLNPKSFNTSYELFEFDPNTLNTAGWKKLGIRDMTIHTIQNYLNKGGKFRNKEDVQKIYNLSEKDYFRISGYIRIKSSSEAYTKNESGFSSNSYKESFVNSGYTKPKSATIDINLADTTEYIALPGIGSKLANRIIQFREKLGGFYKVEQIAEVFALPDSTFQKIKPRLVINQNPITPFNINHASKDDMKNHPYIKWTLANAIVEYRTQHGPYVTLEDLLKIALINEDVLEKLKPYLTVQ
jgi:competence protein ComEA